MLYLLFPYLHEIQIKLDTQVNIVLFDDNLEIMYHYLKNTNIINCTGACNIIQS